MKSERPCSIRKLRLSYVQDHVLSRLKKCNEGLIFFITFASSQLIYISFMFRWRGEIKSTLISYSRDANSTICAGQVPQQVITPSKFTGFFKLFTAALSDLWSATVDTFMLVNIWKRKTGWAASLSAVVLVLHLPWKRAGVRVAFFFGHIEIGVISTQSHTVRKQGGNDVGRCRLPTGSVYFCLSEMN